MNTLRRSRLFFVTTAGLIASTLPAAVTFAVAQETTPPTITGLSSLDATRSGYVEVYGSGFESTGRLVIGGIDAFVTGSRTDRVIGYVPESASLGTATVQVFNSIGGSNEALVNVTQRQPNGRIRWSFRMSAPYSSVKPALGTDGTLYIVDVFDHLYAVSPEGALQWVVNNAGEKGVGVGADGTIYTASSYEVKAFTPQGTLLWVYDIDPPGFVSSGLAVGPDGNIYVLASSGPGVFALTPAGELLWTEPESYGRPTISYPDLVFGPNDGESQLYFYANGHVPAVEIDGGTRNCNILHAYRSPIDVGPDGSIHMVNQKWTPNCELIWEFDLGSNRPNNNRNGPAPSVGPDGMHYMIINSVHFYGLRSNGTQRWHLTLALEDALKAPEVDPTNTQILFGSSNSGLEQGFVSSRSTNNGHELWRQTFPTVNGFNHFVDTRARFTPDGTVAYVSTFHGTANVNENASLFHAIDITPGGDCPVPPQVQGVGFPSSTTRLEWDAAEAGALYDVVRGSLTAAEAGGGPGCLMGGMPETWVDDPDRPAWGEGYYYNVRSENSCGAGSWGNDSAGNVRPYGACP